MLAEKSSSELLTSIIEIRGSENQAIADIVLHLAEIDSRGLYRDVGYSSLFTYCTEGLRYSESSAYRRIQAARALKDNPEIYQLLKEGQLTLCAVSEVVKVKKEPEVKAELLQSSIGKARMEVQKLTAVHRPAQASQRKEKISIQKVVIDNSLPLFQVPVKEETRTTLKVEVDEEFMALYQEARSYIGTQPMAAVLKKTLKEFVSKRKKQPKLRVDKVSPSANPPKTSKPRVKSASRYIPRLTRYRVRQRDNHQCSYQSPCGHKCQETKGLQIDHIYPFALGGSNELSNLRLLCPAHNQLMAETSYGKAKIQSYFRGGSRV